MLRQVEAGAGDGHQGIVSHNGKSACVSTVSCVLVAIHATDIPQTDSIKFMVDIDDVWSLRHGNLRVCTMRLPPFLNEGTQNGLVKAN